MRRERTWFWYFCSLECFNCGVVGDGDSERNMLFRTCWNLILVSYLFCLMQGWGTQGESNITSFCFRCKSREQRFWLQEGGFKIFLRGPRDGLPQAVKKICFESGMEFLVAGWSRFFDFLIEIWDNQWKILL